MKTKRSPSNDLGLFVITWEEIHSMLIPANGEEEALELWVDNKSIGDQTFVGFCGDSEMAKLLKRLPKEGYFINDYSI